MAPMLVKCIHVFAFVLVSIAIYWYCIELLYYYAFPLNSST